MSKTKIGRHRNHMIRNPSTKFRNKNCNTNVSKNKENYLIHLLSSNPSSFFIQSNPRKTTSFFPFSSNLPQLNTNLEIPNLIQKEKKKKKAISQGFTSCVENPPAQNRNQEHQEARISTDKQRQRRENQREAAQALTIWDRRRESQKQ